MVGAICCESIVGFTHNICVRYMNCFWHRYANMFGCDKWLYSFGLAWLGFVSMGKQKDNVNCNHPQGIGWVAVAYFVFFCIIGAQIMLMLFIGIVASTMHEADIKQKRMKVDEVF